MPGWADDIKESVEERKQERKKSSFTTIAAIGLIALLLLLVGAAYMSIPADLTREDARDATVSWLSESTAEEMPEYDMARIEKAIHALVNLKRVENSVPQVAFDDNLNSIARAYSDDMVARGFYSHYSPEGETFQHRYSRAEFECSVPTGDGFITFGAENIYEYHVAEFYKGYNEETMKPSKYRSETEIAEGIVNGWMDSPGHKDTMLKPYWGSEGIGVAIKEDGTLYATQNFC